MVTRTALLFPGLGAYSAGVLRQARTHHPVIGEIFAEIDEVAAERGLPSVSATLFGEHAPGIRELLERPAELLQLAIFGTSVATHRVLTELGVRPDLLLGHSFGEMAALVAAGAFDLADGARLVCARCEALREWEGRGMMAAVGTTERAAQHLVEFLEEPDLVVGCANGPRQTVLSGPLDAVERAERVATALDLPFARLQLPYASHHPAMRPAVATFVELMGDVRQRPLRQPVFSPIHLRRYTDDDDLRQALAECLVLPVRFTQTVRQLHAQRYTTFVEAGALNALTRCVELTVPGVRTAAPLVDPSAEVDGLRAAAELCGAAPAPRQDSGAEVAVVSSVVAETSRDEVLDELRRMYASALEYPLDVLTEDAQLEADLGVDSLKQTSLLAKVVDRFGLTDAASPRVWELPTLGHLADHVAGARPPARARS